ncbi:Lrp/AsnC ligand binding domain-containing protein [Streptosporangium sp. NPDC001681]|uniref:Lrp/AsnC ligand binding domain-containing protein n=1 Tax=Streptosporangium sp. NPDC001681 TaxID=3154395 RepID=UPI0033205A34
MGYVPQVDVVAAGCPVQALATLEITQGRLEEVCDLLLSLPGVIEAYATTGAGDVVCRLASASNLELQLQLLLELNRSVIRRSTSVVVLSTLVAPRTLPLLPARNRSRSSRAGSRPSGAV